MTQRIRENRILSQLYALVVYACTYMWRYISSVVPKHTEQKPLEVSESKAQEQMVSQLHQWADANELPDININAQSKFMQRASQQHLQSRKQQLEREFSEIDDQLKRK